MKNLDFASVSSTYEFEWPQRLLAGLGSLAKLPSELRRLKAHKVLLLSDSVLQSLGLVERVERVLRQGGFEYHSFCEIPVESDSALLMRLYQLAQDKHCDAVLSLGGGSVLDSGKALVLMLNEKESDLLRLESYEFFSERRYPHICIPTSSGTGSETGHGAVIAHQGRKLLLAGPALYPHVALLDPEFTLTMPPRLSVATAMDAWTHAWEALGSRQSNAVSNLLASWCVWQIPASLDAVLKNPRDHGARLRLSEAASLAGIAFTHSMVNLAHALAHSLAAQVPIAHGEAVALFLPLSVSWSMVQGQAYESLKAERLMRGLQTNAALLNWLFEQRHAFLSQVHLPLCLAELVPDRLHDPALFIDKLLEKALLDGTSVFVAGRLQPEVLRRLIVSTCERKVWTLGAQVWV